MADDKILALLQKLDSDDATERRFAIEDLMFEDLNDQDLKIISSKIEDTDRGVRNAASTLLMSKDNCAVPGFITPFVASEEISVRNLAGEILIQYGSKSVSSLLNFLPQGNDDDKKFVIDVLGLIGDQKAGPDILTQIDNTTNDNILLACQEALGNLKYEPSVPKLLEQYSKNELYKPTIIEALGKIGSKTALDFMFTVYSEEDELTKFSLIESFGLIGDERTFFFLLSQLNTCTGPIVWPIISAIYSLKIKYSFDIPFDETMKNALLQTVLDSDDVYKEAAIRLISAFNDKDLILACLKIFGTNSELDVLMKQKFIENPRVILSNISSYLKSSARNLNYLLQLLQELIEFEEGDVQSLLSMLEIRNLNDALADGIENPDEEVRRTAFEILYFINEDMAMLFVDKVVADDNIWNRLKLLELIVDNNSDEAITALKKLAQDSDEIVRERAKEILTEKITPHLKD
jgi:HEAT repeat protein